MKSRSKQGRTLAARRHFRNHAIEPCEPRLLLSALPADHRGWETVPGVIRNDGIETFAVEIEPGQPVNRITFANPNWYFVAPASNEALDDGLGADRVAGDGIYTTGKFRYDTTTPMPQRYGFGPADAAGVYATHVAAFTIELTDASTQRFLVEPGVGILDKNIPLVQGRTLAPDVVATPHFLNIRGDDKDTQKAMRSENTSIQDLTNRVYDALGNDDYDFLAFVSTYKIEHHNWTDRDNFTAGLHWPVQANYSGTGTGPYDGSSGYGSDDGRLLSLNFLDTYDRGMHSYNLLHEILHQWGANLSGLGLTDGTGHWNVHTSVASLLGGTDWIPNGDGSYHITSDGAGRGGAVHASPLDLYLMGLIDASELPPIHVANADTWNTFDKWDGEPILPTEIVRTVTAADIIAAHGARTPGPATAQKDFRLAFVGESNGRLMNPTELTYYEYLADYITRDLPGLPDWKVGHGWMPITRFFGHGSTWRSDLTLPEVQKFTVAGAAFLDRNANGLRDANETGISGRTIFIDLDGDRVYDPSEVRAITAADGSWSLAQLDPGTYNVCQATINGFTVIAPDDRCHTLTLVDAALADVDFANFPTRFEGTAAADHFLVRLDPTGSAVEIYLDALAAEPDYTFPPTLLPAYQVLGRNGDDLLTVDFANGNPLPSLALLFMGEGDTSATGGPGDRLEILGAGRTYGSAQSTITRDGKGVGYNLVEEIIVRDGTFNFTTPVPLVGLRVADDAEATFAGPQLFTSLTLDGDARVVPDANTVLLALDGVTIADDAALDLHDADLIVQGTPDTRRALLDALAVLVRRSRDASPRWSGPGITTSSAATLTGLVTLLNDNGSGTPLVLNHPILTGAPLNKDMVLVRHTYNGDANLDGRINADDYFRIDQGFLSQPAAATYAQGDFNYDRRINADDYFLIDQAFLGQGAVLAGSGDSSPPSAAATLTLTVPEDPKPKTRRTARVDAVWSATTRRDATRRRAR